MTLKAFLSSINDRLSRRQPSQSPPRPSQPQDSTQRYTSHEHLARPKPTFSTTISSASLTASTQRAHTPKSSYTSRAKSRSSSRSPGRLSARAPTATAGGMQKAKSPSGRTKLRIQVPLYIYPTPTSWDPLFSTLATHPNVLFDVIVNPFNGPGAGPAPDANYVAQMTRLHSFPNVTVYGYVHVSWAERSLEDVFADVRIYEGWNLASTPRERSPLAEGNDSGVELAGAGGKADYHVQGIFVDEAPYHLRHVGYMSSLHAYVRRTLSRGTLVWSNPGCPVDRGYYAYADRVTCFENGYSEWLERGMEGFDGGRAERGRSSVMIHSVPRGGEITAEVVRKAREEGVEGVFVTVDRGYESFGSGWGEMVSAVADAA